MLILVVVVSFQGVGEYMYLNLAARGFCFQVCLSAVMKSSKLS